MRTRPDGAVIKGDWIVRTIQAPVREVVQKDGRIRRWGLVPEKEKSLFKGGFAGGRRDYPQRIL